MDAVADGLSGSGRWILGRRGDALWILLPGVFGIALTLALQEFEALFLIYSFLALVIVDAGHVYATATRTVFRKQERNSHWIYWVAPLAAFSGVALWVGSQVGGFWSFIFYLTLFHHVRQFYGINRWYQKLHGRFCRVSNFFVYALTIGPIVLLHLRDPLELEFFTTNDLLFFDAPGFYEPALVVYGLLLLGWAGYEIALLARGIVEPGRALFMLTAAVVYGVCCNLGNSTAEIVLPMLLAHGVPYAAILAVSLIKLEPTVYRGSFGKAFLYVLAVASVLGIAEYFFDTMEIATRIATYATGSISTFDAVVAGIYLTPLLCHYAWDAYIWTGRHPEARVVFK